jgi:hypothetical protein
MGSKRPETPLPRGADTGLLGWLTSVGTPETGYQAPPTVERLLMRLRIFFMFFAALPIAIGAFIAAALAMTILKAVLPADQLGTVGGPVVLVVLLGSILGLAYLAMRFFTWLTRGYRGQLERRSAEMVKAQADAAAFVANRGQALDQPALAELDARFAPTSKPDARGVDSLR